MSTDGGGREPKASIRRDRVLSPNQTESFEQLPQNLRALVEDIKTKRLTALRDLAREVIAAHPGVSVHELAEFVAKLTPAEDIAGLFVDLLEPVVADVLSRQRRDALDRNLKPRNRSPKLEERRKWWADLLAARVHVGDTFKTVGECTVDDLTVCIEERRQHITRVEAQIANYTQLIALMVKHQARTVADLPEQDEWAA